MSEKTKNVLLAVLVVGLVSMTVAYATLSTTLTIENNATVAATNWDVHFANLVRDTNSTTTVTTEPSLTATSITGLQATFVKPGDYVSYTFNIVNSGDIDAKLATFTKETPTCGEADTNGFCASNIEYELSYDDNGTATQFQTGSVQFLNHNQTITATLTIRLKSSVTAMPTTALTVSGIGATFVYEQK